VGLQGTRLIAVVGGNNKVSFGVSHRDARPAGRIV
jgi:hypothetical protein